MSRMILTCALSLSLGAFVVATLATPSPFDDPVNETPPADPGLDQQVMPPGGMARMPGGVQRGGAPELPKFEDVAKDYKPVVSMTGDERPMYRLWTRDRDASVLAELPANFESQLVFIAYTVTGGIPTAGVQFGDMYAKWKRYDRRLALIEPNFRVRTTGDQESKHGHERVFTDRVILEVPIVAQGPGGGVVINMSDLLLGQSAQFFGARTRGANRNLATIATAKSFPRNVEVGFELPFGNGRIGSLHYSWSVLPAAGSTGYRPRVADNRVGYFTTTYRDIGDASKDTPWVRYVNRWHLEKADPSLKLSPPKQPIVFYIEHTTPVRYRRWVRDGVLEWNKAFEKVGILNAIEVYQQDARTGAHMEKDPADARYNFVLWTNAGMGFAIGPSRVDPRNGQILDADIVMDEGFITSWAIAWRQLIPELAMESFGPETLAWLDSRPQWDPRVRLAPPAEREDVIHALAAQRADRGIHRFGLHPAGNVNRPLMGAEPYDGLAGRVSQVNGMCMNALTKSLDLAILRLDPEIILEIIDMEFENRVIGMDDISGTWTGGLTIPEVGQIEVGLNLTLHEGNTVTGTADAIMGSVDVSGEYNPEDGSLTLKGDFQGMEEIHFDLKVNGEEMTGWISGGGDRLAVSFRRTSRPTPRTEVVVVARDDAADDEPADDAEAPAADAEAEKPKEPKPKEPRRAPSDMLDGMPESFVGPLLRDIVMHEVGHTLGLRHNFKASSAYSMEEINSPDHAGKAITGSVMDYNPLNVNFGDGPVQGDYSMTTIGPYDYWAIEYGYTLERDLKPILARVAEPELAYATDEDTWGPDPLARRFDMGRDPLDYADSQMRLVQHLRGKLLDRVVKDGESWSKARRGYEILLGRHFGAASIAANWVGGSNVNRDHKGDPGDRPPVQPISAEQQRRALTFVIDNIFSDEAYGLSAELLSRMTVDKWWDDGGFGEIFQDNTWPVHDRIMGIQAAALTMILNPTTLNRVYDNEFRIEDGEDAVTLPEVMFTVADEVWAELNRPVNRSYSARQPLISSLRRNLQSEHLKRLIDLSMPNPRFGASGKAVSNLSVYKLRELKGRIDRIMDRHAQRLDPYTLAHLDETRVRIEKSLDAQYIYNTDAFNMGGGFGGFIFLKDDESAPRE